MDGPRARKRTMFSKRVLSASGSPKRKRRATELSCVGDKIVPESVQYLELLEFEKQLDAVCARKRLEYQAATQKPVATYKKNLRILVSNIVELGDEGMVSWTFKVDGRLMDHRDKDASDKRPVVKRRFSSFVKRAFVELENEGDRCEGDDWQSAEWHASSSLAECDGFEMKRVGDIATAPTRAKVLLELAHSPEQFKLRRDLAEMVGLYQATKKSALAAIWNYIKAKQLQDQEDPEYVNCDVYLQRICSGKSRVRFSEVAEELAKLLLPVEPVTLVYDLSMDPNKQPPKAAYDIDVDVDEKFKEDANSLLRTDGVERTVRELDDKVQELTKELEEAREKREFMLMFADDPKEFLIRWLASQARDKSLENKVQGQLSETQRHAEYYKCTQTQEAVYRYYGEELQLRRKKLLDAEERAKRGKK